MFIFNSYMKISSIYEFRDKQSLLSNENLRHKQTVKNKNNTNISFTSAAPYAGMLRKLFKYGIPDMY